MESSESVAKVMGAFVAAQADLPDVPKKHEAQAGQRRYAYADLGDIVKAVRPVLAKHGLAFTQQVGQADGCVTITTTIMHASGEWFGGGSLALASGDSAQSVGSAITYGKRYALSAVLGLVAEDDDDGASASASPAPRQRAQAPAPKAATGVITEAQIAALWTIAGERCKRFDDPSITRETIARAVFEAHKIKSSKDIRKVEYDAIVQDIETWDIPGASTEPF